MNYTLRFTSGLWPNGGRTRQHGYEDPDSLMGAAAYPPSGLGVRQEPHHSACSLELSGLPGQVGEPPSS